MTLAALITLARTYHELTPEAREAIDRLADDRSIDGYADSHRRRALLWVRDVSRVAGDEVELAYMADMAIEFYGCDRCSDPTCEHRSSLAF